TAQRYLLFLLTAEGGLARELGQELLDLVAHVKPCARCGNLAEVVEDAGPTLCAICLDSKRDPNLLCIVARVHDLFAIERAGTMRGRYFVLGKLLSPLEGVGPDDLPIDKLVERIRSE